MKPRIHCGMPDVKEDTIKSIEKAANKIRKEIHQYFPKQNVKRGYNLKHILRMFLIESAERELYFNLLWNKFGDRKTADITKDLGSPKRCPIKCGCPKLTTKTRNIISRLAFKIAKEINLYYPLRCKDPKKSEAFREWLRNSVCLRFKLAISLF